MKYKEEMYIKVQNVRLFSSNQRQIVSQQIDRAHGVSETEKKKKKKEMVNHKEHKTLMKRML